MMTSADHIGRRVRALRDIDRIIHEPGRHMIMTVLSVVKDADFLFLLRLTGLTKGNLSSHLSRLEGAGYVDISKEFVEKTPRTLIRLTDNGGDALNRYRSIMREAIGEL